MKTPLKDQPVIDGGTDKETSGRGLAGLKENDDTKTQQKGNAEKNNQGTSTADRKAGNSKSGSGGNSSGKGGQNVGGNSGGKTGNR